MKNNNQIFSRQRYITILMFFAMICFQNQVFCLVGKLRQIKPTQLQLVSDQDMVINNKNLNEIMSFSIDELNTSRYSYILSQQDAKTIDIKIEYSESFIYKYAILTIKNPEAIKDSSGAKLDKTTYTSQIESVFIFTDAEKTIQNIIPFVVWGFLGVFIICTICLLITKIDTVGIWIVIEFFQICGIINYLSIIKARPLVLFLSELNKGNFFFIPTLFYKLLTIINSSLSTESSDVFIHDEDILSPSSTSFIRTTGNALIIVSIYSLLTLAFSFNACRGLQSYFNLRCLYRLLDVLLIHFVFASVINIRFFSFNNGYSIADFFLSILALISYVFYSTVIPCKKVNDADIIMLKKEAIERNKHFINKVRVEFFFSRNFYFFRTLFKLLITTGIALGTLNNGATGAILPITIVYFISIFFLSLKYPLYDDKRLNALQVISILSLLFLLVLLLVLWCFQEFYRLVSRKSSSQVDSTYIAINQYFSWSLVCLLVLSKICFLSCLFSYFYSTRKEKNQFLSKMSKKHPQKTTQKTMSNLNEDLIDNNNTITNCEPTQDDSNNNMNFKYNNKNRMSFNHQKDIELSKQQKQNQNVLDITTLQSQMYESPQKLMNSENKTKNGQVFQINLDTISNSQQSQKQQKISPRSQKAQPSQFNYFQQNESSMNYQQEQEQEFNLRLQAKTSTFSGINNNH